MNYKINLTNSCQSRPGTV